MHQLYAKIKSSSKYFNQNSYAERYGKFPFPVKIVPTSDEYCVQGGPGGQYRLEDVDLFVIVGDKKIKFQATMVEGAARANNG